MISKLLLLSALILLIMSKPAIASQTDIENYFEKQPVKIQNGEVEHAKYGRMAATESPYSSEYNQCEDEIFSEKSFTFGEQKISDPNKLNSFVDDYFVHTIALSYPESKERDLYVKPIFYDPKFNANYEEINQLISKTLECVKRKGWSYVKSTK